MSETKQVLGMFLKAPSHAESSEDAMSQESMEHLLALHSSVDTECQKGLCAANPRLRCSVSAANQNRKY